MIADQSLRQLAFAAELLNAAAGGMDGSQDVRSIGELLDEVRSENPNGGHVSLDGGIRAIITNSSFTGSQAAGQPQLAPPQQRGLFLRDIVPVVPITQMTVPFVRELAPQSGEMGVSGVAEAATVPDASALFNFQPILITPGELAGNITVTDQLWSDSPAFVAYVNQRLPYAVKVREEYACFNGNAEVVNGGITGILNDSAVSASTPGNGLVSAITKMSGTLAGNGVLPDTAFVNASDYFAMVLAMTGATTAYPPSVLELLPTIVPTVSLASGTVIVGDFANGAAIIERAEVTLSVYPQHSNYRVNDQNLVQAEERIGWHVIAPWRFTYATGITP